ncbi:hypothetical protein [Stappia sp.]|uniref:hypothetical protein n=1 Tax=Stappia sp. TaxID=1870903 RepID=UPI003A9A4E8F
MKVSRLNFIRDFFADRPGTVIRGTFGAARDRLNTFRPFGFIETEKPRPINALVPVTPPRKPVKMYDIFVEARSADAENVLNATACPAH